MRLRSLLEDVWDSPWWDFRIEDVRGLVATDKSSSSIVTGILCCALFDLSRSLRAAADSDNSSSRVVGSRGRGMLLVWFRDDFVRDGRRRCVLMDPEL